MFRKLFIKLNCLLGSHEWTSNHEQGIAPTEDQIKRGLAGFAEYARMYCEHCGHKSSLKLKG